MEWIKMPWRDGIPRQRRHTNTKSRKWLKVLLFLVKNSQSETRLSRTTDLEHTRTTGVEQRRRKTKTRCRESFVECAHVSKKWKEMGKKEKKRFTNSIIPRDDGPVLLANGREFIQQSTEIQLDSVKEYHKRGEREEKTSWPWRQPRQERQRLKK